MMDRQQPILLSQLIEEVTAAAARAELRDPSQPKVPHRPPIWIGIILNPQFGDINQQAPNIRQ
jgi:hypothetical protein